MEDAASVIIRILPSGEVHMQTAVPGALVEDMASALRSAADVLEGDDTEWDEVERAN